MFVKALALAATLLTTTAWAVDFEDVGLAVYAGGERFVSQGYTAAVTSAHDDAGLNGAIVNGGDVNSCFIVDCPAGNASQYFLGLNDGGVEFSRVDPLQSFEAVSFEASFVAPVAGLDLPEPVARLRVYGRAATTSSFLEATFTLPGHDANGMYAFTAFSLAGTTFASVELSSFGVYACLIDGDRCASPADNQAQFALDNLVLSAVPEPSTHALFGLGLLLLGGLRSRRSATAHTAAVDPAAEDLR